MNQSHDKSASPDSNRKWISLTPLTPDYNEDEHGIYVKHLMEAVKEDAVRNIALSGHYGSGKSSILREFTDRYEEEKKALFSRLKHFFVRQQTQRDNGNQKKEKAATHKNTKYVVEISLSTLASAKAYNNSATEKQEGSLPAQAMTITNRIQQEIVKQLLYREDPDKTRSSRFRRIERFQVCRTIKIATFLGLCTAITASFTGWTTKILDKFLLPLWPGTNYYCSFGIVFLVTLSIIFCACWLFYGTVWIKQFSAGPATVTLDEKSVSYFDQYLDEIVYFFEVSKSDIVIFEDIDRFNDSHIFETLRSLNTLLNSSPQIKNPIHFIYAIKDSIFKLSQENADKQKKENITHHDVSGTDRTKFFDLIVPVVPFITHKTARSLARKLLDDKIKSHNIDDKLLDIATPYIPDMRLLKNIINEFIIFKERLFLDDGKGLDLNETELFAMMIYKNKYLKDFENIRSGKSKLDDVYSFSRRFARELTTYLEKVNTIKRISNHLGEKLIAHIKYILKAVNYSCNNFSLTFRNKELTEDQIKDVKFWDEFIYTNNNDDKLYYKMNTNHQVTFTKEDISNIINYPLDQNIWDNLGRREILKVFPRGNEEIDILNHADFAALAKITEFYITDSERKRTFSDFIKETLESDLAYQLISNGYITRNFTLYTSRFHGARISANAMNFIIHHINRNKMDEYFELSNDEARAVIDECNKNILEKPSSYNIYILDFLLKNDQAKAEIMINSLISFGDDQRALISAYLSRGKEPQRLIQELTPKARNMLVYLIDEAELEGKLQVELVNTALENISSETEQDITPSVSSYLLENYGSFTALTSDTTEAQNIEPITKLYEEAGLKLPDLTKLGHEIRLAFINKNLYEITYENLICMFGSAENTSLDNIKRENDIAYKYILAHLKTYLCAITEDSQTITESSSFVEIIKDIHNLEEAPLKEIIERADPSCRVQDISDLPEDTWPVLASCKRFPATFNNISQYFTQHGSIDAPLAAILEESGTITESNGHDEGDEKAKLAYALLEARDLLPSTGLRVKLVESLALQHPLNVEFIQPEDNNLFALLLESNIIGDNATSYARLTKTSWETRQAFIHKSKNFPEYMTSEVVRDDWMNILKDDDINHVIKENIIKDATVYTKNASELTDLMQYELRKKYKLPFETLENIFCERENIDPNSQHLLLPLLNLHVEGLEREQIYSLLGKMGENYPALKEKRCDQPLIHNSSENRTLLNHLKQKGIISSYKEESEFLLRVYKKRKSPSDDAPLKT
ncbi:ATP-binding protein [Acetobacteraceae bacterium ESL0709]|nr:ATP-binding protein [Acetobacteraceae bacterium ESL0697]MDF7677686.1 ATP-binding protein [Acetobacteraceae bacterium ESL0709]